MTETATKTDLAAGSQEWPVVAFGDIVQMVSERVDPGETELEVYVGLEHLDPESLKIRRHGTPDDVSGQKLKFYKGDIIFGKRRAYQRKLAVAHCDGICSAHAMVLRAKPKVVLPEFLPFFMQGDMFMERAVAISVGSLSPTINWKTLKVQEFPLPPVDEQRRIAQLLWAADDSIQKWVDTEACTQELLQAFIDERLQPDTAVGAGWRDLKFSDLVDEEVILPPQDGNHGEKHPKASDYVESGIPFVMANDVRDNAINLTTCKFIPKSLADTLRIGFAEPDDVLLTHKGTVGESALLGEISTPYVMLTPQVTRYRVLDDGKLDRRFLLYSFKSTRFQRIIQARSAQSTRAYVGILAQRDLPILVPDIDVQVELANQCDEIECSKLLAIEHVKKATHLTKQLTAHLIGGTP